MKITTRRGIWGFAFAVTFLSVLFACGLNVLVFSPEILAMTLRGTLIITPCVTMPTCLFVGAKIYENQLLSDELQAIVERDRLTDVATRDFFFERLSRRERDYGVSLMIDIDHFKRVNDAHGHLVGDEVIKMVAQALQEQVRETDVVCRFGGEEFVVFLHRSSEGEGWQIAERMREAIAAQVTQSDTGDVRVTISVGGSMKEQLEQVEDAIRRADSCLYKAKALGRNRTVVDWSEAEARAIA